MELRLAALGLHASMLLHAIACFKRVPSQVEGIAAPGQSSFVDSKTKNSCVSLREHEVEEAIRKWRHGLDGKNSAGVTSQAAKFDSIISQVGADVYTIITRPNDLFQEINVLVILSQ